MKVISKAKIKFVQSLKRKKYRYQHKVYVIEGEKACQTVIEAGHLPEFVFFADACPSFIPANVQSFITEERAMKEISSLNTPSSLLCVFPMKNKRDLELNAAKGNVILFLDRIQDPGNLGTIIRTADWYGLKSVILNEGCTDLYNPKTIQSTMGCHVNFNIYHAEIEGIKQSLPDAIILALDMNGTAMSEAEYNKQSIILAVGNEGQGLSKDIVEAADQVVSIPGHPDRVAESLNAAIATAISLDRLAKMLPTLK